jgi:hypothetical protein
MMIFERVVLDKILGINFSGLARSIAFLLLVFSSSVQAETIDFEGIGTITGPPFDVVSMGYTVQQTMNEGTPEPIIRAASISPNGTDLYGICGFCADMTGFNLYANDGSTFNLVSIDLGGFGNAADEFDFTLTGYTATGGTLTESLTISVPEGMQTLVLDTIWQNLSSVTVLVNNVGNAGFSGSAYDNIVLAPGPTTVVIDVLPDDSTNVVYPNQTGKLPVAVLSSADFDAVQVDPATLKFGMGEATQTDAVVIADVDGQFGDDTIAKFKVQESGIFCADTEVTLTGETYAGEQFTGTGSIDASECKTGGCHAY